MKRETCPDRACDTGLLAAAGTASTTNAQGLAHRFSGAPNGLLVNGSERTLNFLLIAQTADGEILAQQVVDPTGSWSLEVPTTVAGRQIIFVMAEPGDPTDVCGTTDPIHLLPGADTALAVLPFFSLDPPLFDITGEWDLLITISRVGGVCTDTGSYTTTASIQQTNGLFLISGLNSSTDWRGFISGDRVLFNGSRHEDGGLTEATSGFTLSADGH